MTEPAVTRHSAGVKPEAPVAVAPPSPAPAAPAGSAARTDDRFIEVYRQHFPYVWRSLRRLGVPEPAIDDAAQDVFVVVHRRLGEFEGRSSERTWVYGIAIRVARAHRRRSAAPAPSDVELVSEGPSPFDELAAGEATRILEGLLDALDETKREVFVLAELEEMSAPEIAACLEVKVNTVYSRLRAARADFERALARRRASGRREKR